MSLYIKNRIRAELSKKELPDLKFLYSKEVLEVAEDDYFDMLNLRSPS